MYILIPVTQETIHQSYKSNPRLHKKSPVNPQGDLYVLLNSCHFSKQNTLILHAQDVGSPTSCKLDWKWYEKNRHLTCSAHVYKLWHTAFIVA